MPPNKTFFKTALYSLMFAVFFKLFFGNSQLKSFSSSDDYKDNKKARSDLGGLMYMYLLIKV